jgi:hypothetical protein
MKLLEYKAFEEQINEGYNTTLVVVDIQQGHEVSWSLITESLYDYLSQFNTIIWFFNDSDMGYEDTESNIGYFIKMKLEEHGFYNDDGYSVIDKINFVGKQYGYIRGAMDQHSDSDDLVDLLAFMKKNDYYSTYDVVELYEEYESDINDDDSLSEDDCIKMFCNKYKIDVDLFMIVFEGDHMSINEEISDALSRVNKCSIIGGGVNECLLEVEILMEAIGVKYKRNNKYTY